MNPLNDTLRQITVEAFESLCQIFPAGEGAQAGAAPLEGTVSVHFSGPVKGTFTLCFYGRLRQAVATAMLEGAPSLQQEEDAMKEMANIICGNMLPYVAGPSPVFKLEAPQSESLPAAASFPETALTAQIAFPEGSAAMSLVVAS